MIRNESYSNVKAESRCVEVHILKEFLQLELLILGSDITIMRGDVFYRIVSESDLDVLDVKAAEQIEACTYDQKPIHLDGQIDMKVSLLRK